MVINLEGKGRSYLVLVQVRGGDALHRLAASLPFLL
jgi:hypothetical protein